jgi:hypothetical protein
LVAEESRATNVRQDIVSTDLVLVLDQKRLARVVGGYVLVAWFCSGGV